MTATSAWGFGLATLDSAGHVLDVWFPAPALGTPTPEPREPAELAALAVPDEARGVTREVRLVEIVDLAAAPASTEDVWLRLHLLSARLVVPHSISTEGLFGLLTNVVWTSAGPCAVEGFETTRARLKATGQHVSVHGVDKFPRMTDYVRARPAYGSPTRTGSGSAPTSPSGTTVMHEGFVNFNAGTLGSLDGRGADLGGRRRRRRLRHRRRRLDHGHPVRWRQGGHLGSASAACWAPTPASASPWATTASSRPGCYVTAGTKVTVTDTDGQPQVVKALELSGASNVLFRRNSVTGAVEAVPWHGEGIALNAALHAND